MFAWFKQLALSDASHKSNRERAAKLVCKNFDDVAADVQKFRDPFLRVWTWLRTRRFRYQPLFTSESADPCRTTLSISRTVSHVTTLPFECLRRPATSAFQLARFRRSEYNNMASGSAVNHYEYSTKWQVLGHKKRFTVVTFLLTNDSNSSFVSSVLRRGPYVTWDWQMYSWRNIWKIGRVIYLEVSAGFHTNVPGAVLSLIPHSRISLRRENV